MKDSRALTNEDRQDILKTIEEADTDKISLVIPTNIIPFPQKLHE